MIVKIQLPLNDPEAPALVYNRDHSFEVHMSISDELAKAMRGRPKVFFFAYSVHDELLIDQEAPWQDW